jgi:FkbM family methyltransferase
MVIRLLKGGHLGRIRFDITIRNAIRGQQHSEGPLMPMPSEFASTPQSVPPQPTSQAAPPRSVKRAVKSFLLLLLTPLKPAARLVRRFLVGQIEIQIANLHQRMGEVQANLHQRIGEVQANLHQRIGEVQANLHQRIGEVQAVQDQTRNLIQDRTQGLIALVQEMSAVNRSRGEEFSTQISNSLALLQLLHDRVQETALRTRAAILVDESTFALRTLDGFVLVPRHDTLLLLMLLDAGPEGLEPGTRRVLSKLLVPGATFVDAGAHIGLLTLAGARAVGASGKVLAIEPVPLSFELLQRSLTINGLAGRVEGKCQAVGAHHARCKFFVRDVLGHSSLTQGKFAAGGDEIEVSVTPLDELVRPSERVDVIKIDVEGAELAVLEGMTRVIAESPELSIIAEFGPSHLRAADVTPEEWLSAFQSRGFDPFVIDELSGDCRLADVSKLKEVESVNILFCRRGSSALARVLR